jgi:hypothetical protein
MLGDLLRLPERAPRMTGQGHFTTEYITFKSVWAMPRTVGARRRPYALWEIRCKRTHRRRCFCYLLV